MSKKFNSYLRNFIMNNNVNKMAVFWFVFTILEGFILISYIGVKPVLGIYNPEEISIDNAFVKVVGRTYDKSILINDGSIKYEAACMYKYNLICEKFFQKDFSANRIKFVQMVDNKGFLIYSEFIDPFAENSVIVIDSINSKEDLEKKYVNANRFIRFVMAIPVFLTMFFCLMVLLKALYIKQQT